jgi:hypothetical protein
MLAPFGGVNPDHSQAIGVGVRPTGRASRRIYSPGSHIFGAEQIDWSPLARDCQVKNAFRFELVSGARISPGQVIAERAGIQVESIGV